MVAKADKKSKPTVSDAFVEYLAEQLVETGQFGPYGEVTGSLIWCIRKIIDSYGKPVDQ